MSGMTKWNQARTRHEDLSDAIRLGTGDLTELVAKQAAAAADVERLGGWNRMHQVDSILGHIGLTQLDTPVERLSGGDRRRVALGRILISSPDLAVLDEPSNHLDVDTVAWLERFLIETYKGALLIITHDRYLLDRVVTRTLEIEHGRLHSYPGGYGSYLEAKAERLQLEARTEVNRQNFLRTELEWLRRQPKARTGKQKARIQRAEEAVVNKPLPKERTTKLAIDTYRSGKTILELHDVALRIGDRTLGEEISMVVNAGDRIGIVGANGVGKTTLLRSILGELEPSEGTVVMGRNTRVAYFDQHRSDLDLNASVFDNVAGPRMQVELGGRTIDVHAYLERFLFFGQQMRQPVNGLSGGERARVALAKLLSHGENLLVLDKPTNDLDDATLGDLEELLQEFDGCVLVVTHDRWFLNRVATSILSFDGDGRVVQYAGNYDSYMLQRGRREDSAEKQVVVEVKPVREVEKRPRGLTYAERIELNGLLDRVAEAEERVAGLERALSDPALYANGAKDLVDVHKRLTAGKAEVVLLTSRWEALEAKREEGERGRATGCGDSGMR